METDKLRKQLEAVRQDANEIDRMLERSSMETKILDVVAAVELLDDDAVVEYHEEDGGARHAVIVIAKEELSDAKMRALRSYIGAVPNWHLDDRERKNNTWKIRPH